MSGPRAVGKIEIDLAEHQCAAGLGGVGLEVDLADIGGHAALERGLELDRGER